MSKEGKICTLLTTTLILLQIIFVLSLAGIIMLQCALFTEGNTKRGTTGHGVTANAAPTSNHMYVIHVNTVSDPIQITQPILVAKAPLSVYIAHLQH